jgi:hypothetical protein
MKAVRIELRLASPTLLAAAPPASNLIESLPFVPGNTVRGLLARRWIDLGGDPDGPKRETLRRLFVNGEVRFGFAFRDGAETVPLSAWSCKYDPGFPPEGHGVRDLLLGAGDGRCACGRALERFEGWWLPETAEQVQVRTRLITRTAIDPARGTARSGQLFSQRVLAEGQRFVATVEAPDELAPKIEDLVAEPFTGRIGTGGSRGQGWVEVQRIGESEARRGAVRERLERFFAAAGRPVLAVTLLTDGLFRDDYLREAVSPRLEDLQPLGIRPDDWEPHADAWIDLRRVFGFDGVPVRLPRAHRLAVAAGSVFLFEARTGAEPAIPEDDGEGWIGEGNGEGYGRAVLWHPFHLDRRAGAAL